MEKTALEKMKRTINKGITMVSVKTNTSVETVKLNAHIDSLEKEIGRLQKEVGSQTYILWKADKFEIGAIEETLHMIDEKKNKMRELQGKIEELMEIKQGEETISQEYVCKCSNCHMEFAEKIKFCVKCGTKID